jgi:hypothetical protein
MTAISIKLSQAISIILWIRLSTKTWMVNVRHYPYLSKNSPNSVPKIAINPILVEQPKVNVLVSQSPYISILKLI